VVDEVPGRGVSFLSGDFPHHFPNLILGQRSVPQ
jgi:hypothetical protein